MGREALKGKGGTEWEAKHQIWGEGGTKSSQEMNTYLWHVIWNSFCLTQQQAGTSQLLSVYT